MRINAKERYQESGQKSFQTEKIFHMKNNILKEEFAEAEIKTNIFCF
jgi:hypothetical protein